MKKPEVGAPVYAVTSNEVVVAGAVTKVGRRYFYAKGGPSPLKIHLDTWDSSPDFTGEYHHYFPCVESANDRIEINRLQRDLRKRLQFDIIHKLSTGQLKRILEILNEA